MTDAAARTGLRAVISGAYVPGVAEAQEVIQALSRAHPDVVHGAIAQDAPLTAVLRERQRVAAVFVPREFDFLWRGLSVEIRGARPHGPSNLFVRVGCSDECFEFDLDSLSVTADRDEKRKMAPAIWVGQRTLFRGTSVAVEHLAGDVDLTVFLHGLRRPREAT